MRILTVIFILLTWGCKTTQRESGVQHAWGQTSRNVDDYKFSPCEQEKFPQFPESVKYLTEVATLIMKSNPNIFKSKLDPSHFCFKVEKQYDLVNAYAKTKKRTIIFTSQQIASVANNAELAAIVAHELAHISMLHDTRIWHPAYRPTPAYKELQLHIDQLENSSPESEAMRERLKQEMAKDPAVGKSEAFNWQEREADEVGFEIYLKSGFPPSSASDYRLSMAYSNITDESDGVLAAAECIALGLKAKTNEELLKLLSEKVARGEGSHPMECWRLLHFIYESRLHLKDYENQPYLGTAKDFSLLRAEALKEIKSQSVLPFFPF